MSIFSRWQSHMITIHFTKPVLLLWHQLPVTYKLFTLSIVAQPVCWVEHCPFAVQFTRGSWSQLSHSLGHSLPSLFSGPVSSDAMPNGNRRAEGFGATGNVHMNGPVPPTAPPQSSTSSPVNSQTQESSPGVAAYPPMMLEKSEGASTEVTVHKGDALQSLRLSMPMQETDLCKHKRLWSECCLPAPVPDLCFFFPLTFKNILLTPFWENSWFSKLFYWYLGAFVGV